MEANYFAPFRPGVPNLSLNMYAFSISKDEHAPLKFL